MKVKLAKNFKNVEILWASVREPYNYLQAKQLGCHIITIPPKKKEKIEENDKFITIKSPIIGTFYRKAAPDKPAFVEVGDTIKEGGILCVIEAMKLFNEIESEVSGTIVKILIDDATPVEFDQPLFLINPS